MTDLIAGACWPCKVGLHEECLDVQMVAPEEPEDQLVDDNWVTCCCTITPNVEEVAERRGVGRPMKDPNDITDILSTGRKRAQMLYPIIDGSECDWAWLKFAGGGVEPVIGCSGNLIFSERGKGGRHHGPNKNVIANEPGNVHRLCMSCHARWHALNNQYYGSRPPVGENYLPLPEHESLRHDPNTRATDEEREDNEKYWATAKIDRHEVED